MMTNSGVSIESFKFGRISTWIPPTKQNLSIAFISRYYY